MNSLKLVLGRYDDPENQKQDNYVVDLYTSNLAIIGSAMSGKTTLLKTLIVRLHQIVQPSAPEEIYILDFSNNLELYRMLPYVYAYFDALNDENVRRLFNVLEKRFYKNIKDLSGKSYVDFPDKSKIPHTTLILDGLNTFYTEDRYSAYQDTLQKLARDGLSKGISIVFAANDNSGGINRLLQSFNRVIGFDLSKDKFSELFSGKIEKPILNKGRGLANMDTDVYEFQAFFPYNSDLYYSSDGESLFLNELRSTVIDKRCIEIDELDQKKLKSFSDDLTISNWSTYTDQCMYRSQGKISVGIDYYSFEPIVLDLLQAQAIAIYGKRKFGKSNLVHLLIQALVDVEDIHFVFWEDKRDGLKAINDITDSLIEGKNKETVYEKSDFEKALYYNGFGKLATNMDIDPEMFRLLNDSSTPIDDESDSIDENLSSGAEMSPEAEALLEEFRLEDENDNISEENEDEENVVTSSDDIHTDTKPREVHRHRFTTFVIQSKFLYQSEPGGDGRQLITRMSSLVSNAAANHALFIFSDVQRIVSPEVRTYFNIGINHAFLMDDILRFVNDRGKNSVFGSQDTYELKENFGKCELGDGFYFNIDADTLTKLKFVKVID